MIGSFVGFQLSFLLFLHFVLLSFSFQIQLDNTLTENRVTDAVITCISDLVFYNLMEDPIKTEHPPGLRGVNT